MPIEAHNSASEAPTDIIYLALVGDYKSGKSQLAATAPGVKLFIDTDRRAQALAGKNNVYALSVYDPPGMGMQPTSYNTIVSIVEQLEVDRRLNKLVVNENGVTTKPFEHVVDTVLVDWLVFDSIQTLADRVRAFILFTNKDLTRTINVGGKLTIRVPYSFDGWSSEMSTVENLVMRARSIPKMNVICIFHEVPEESPNSTQEKPQYTGKIEIYPRRYNPILKYFNEVWRMSRQIGQVPTVILQPDGVFTKAATTFEIKTAQPNMESMIYEARKRYPNAVPKISTQTVGQPQLKQ